MVPDELKQIHMWTSSNLIRAVVLQKSKQFPCEGESRKLNNPRIDLSVCLFLWKVDFLSVCEGLHGAFKCTGKCFVNSKIYT